MYLQVTWINSITMKERGNSTQTQQRRGIMQKLKNKKKKVWLEKFNSDDNGSMKRKKP